MTSRVIAEVASSGPSPHLSWVELACHDAARTPYPLKWRATRGAKLGHVFEVIREACGDYPIPVSSGYRTLKHNRSVGSKDTSQHPKGTAIDPSPPEHMGVARFHRIILDLANDELYGEIGGIGLYPTFVHVDIRETGRLERWHGSRPKADSE